MTRPVSTTHKQDGPSCRGRGGQSRLDIDSPRVQGVSRGVGSRGAGDRAIPVPPGLLPCCLEFQNSPCGRIGAAHHTLFDYLPVELGRWLSKIFRAARHLFLNVFQHAKGDCSDVFQLDGPPVSTSLYWPNGTVEVFSGVQKPFAEMQKPFAGAQ